MHMHNPYTPDTDWSLDDGRVADDLLKDTSITLYVDEDFPAAATSLYAEGAPKPGTD